jgi:hypothetical protein
MLAVEDTMLNSGKETEIQNAQRRIWLFTVFLRVEFGGEAV